MEKREVLVDLFSLGGPRSEFCCESASFCCSFGGEVFVGDILAVHHPGSALTVNVLTARIDNLSETSSLKYLLTFYAIVMQYLMTPKLFILLLH